ncbi:DNA primase [Candidatus Dependentiae bacterium]
MPLFNFVKNNLSILDIVKNYVQIKHMGNYYKAPCPFHSEKEASFTVSPDKQIFYCFGCQAGGDLIAFIAKIENLSQIEAVKFLIDRYQLTIPDEIKKQTPQDLIYNNENRESHFVLHKKFAEWANKQLLNNHTAKDYLLKRNIDLKEIKYFNIGYFPGGVRLINKLLKEMSKENILAQDLIEAGILMKGQLVLYSPFEERILFPIKDNMGRYCGFGGRIFKSVDTRAKYYNSKESICFFKGKLLFGLDLAKQEMKKKSYAYLVEGYTDCVAMIRHGYVNTIATLGTSCTKDHLKLLSRFIHKLYVIYDGDQAGQKAILRLTQHCWEVNLELQIITLPEKEDPASFLGKNGNLKELIVDSIDIFNFFIKSLGQKFHKSSFSEKLELSRKIVLIIEKIQEPFKKELLLQDAATILQLPFSTLKDLMINIRNENKQKFNQNKQKINHLAQKDIAPKNNVPLLEERIFSAIINSIDKPKRLEIDKNLVVYFSEYMIFLIQKLNDCVIKPPTNGSLFDDFLSKLNNSDKNWVISCSIKYEQDVTTNLFKQLLFHFCKHNWKRIIQDMKLKISKAKKMGSEEELKNLFGVFSRLKQYFKGRGLI